MLLNIINAFGAGLSGKKSKQYRSNSVRLLNNPNPVQYKIIYDSFVAVLVIIWEQIKLCTISVLVNTLSVIARGVVIKGRRCSL